MPQTFSHTQSNTSGIIAAVAILLLWLSHLVWTLHLEITSYYFWVLPFVLIQTHLYTGLFITAHDAMHGTVSQNTKVNHSIGALCLILYAAFPYKKLKTEHHKHHKYVATEQDPDYYHGNFWRWYWAFVRHYISWQQFIILGIAFNLLHYFVGVAQINLILFWVIPPLLSTLQLFYFGTYQPHRNPDRISNRHKSRSQGKNHVLALLSCYFFGYHLEHHDSPHLPWWRLWRAKY